MSALPCRILPDAPARPRHRLKYGVVTDLIIINLLAPNEDRCASSLNSIGEDVSVSNRCVCCAHRLQNHKSTLALVYFWASMTFHAVPLANRQPQRGARYNLVKDITQYPLCAATLQRLEPWRQVQRTLECCSRQP